MSCMCLEAQSHLTEIALENGSFLVPSTHLELKEGDLKSMGGILKKEREKEETL